MSTTTIIDTAHEPRRHVTNEWRRSGPDAGKVADASVRHGLRQKPHRLRRGDASATFGALGVVACCIIAGCTGSLNTSDELLGVEPLPALVVAPIGLGTPADGPSLRQGAHENGWDRRHWEMVVIDVPRGQVETNPSGIGRIAIDQSLPRQRGEFPVDVEVLDTAGDPGAAALEGAVNVAAAPGLLLVGLPLEMILDRRWPWSVVNESADPMEAAGRGRRYERVPPQSPRSPWPWIGVDD